MVFYADWYILQMIFKGKLLPFFFIFFHNFKQDSNKNSSKKTNTKGVIDNFPPGNFSSVCVSNKLLVTN